MRTAKKQADILLPEIQELLLPSIVTPPTRRWRVRLRAALATVRWLLLRAPNLERKVAPGRPAAPEHEWRAVRPQRWHA